VRRLGGVVVLALLCGGGCAFFREHEVAIVGDSLSEEAQDQIRAADSNSLSIRAVPGITIGNALPLVEEAVDESPDVVVVELGTNDVLQQTDFRPAVDAMLDATADVPCVAWVRVAVPSLHTVEINQYLDEQARARDNLHIVAWDDVAVLHPDWYVPDGIHHNDAGKEGFAGAIADGIGDCLG
jgi:lysophospholipase L1-like esterase